jgi:hypothetical protein
MKMKKICVISCIVLMLPLISTIAAANQPPSAPDIEGPSSGNAGTQYTYGFCSTDPDGDNITICINWGDGTGDVCIGPFQSGVCATAPHTWLKQGTYTIKAKASDGQVESDWSTLEITMPRGKFFHSLLVSHLLERFPNISIILRYFLNF